MPDITLLDDYRSGQKCPRAKRRMWGRKPASVDTILVHATAVKGGFGVDGRKVDEAVNLITGPDGPTEQDVRARAAMDFRIARYRETPYHGLYSPRDNVSVVQWSADQVTYHGDRPNVRSLGWAYDGLFKPGAEDDLDIEGGRASLRHLLVQADVQGCAIKQIAPHANHAPPPKYAKPHDPGPKVWLNIVVPVALEFGLTLALEWTTGGAEPWAKRWMEVAA